jgi:hypothetical protein
MPFRFRRSFGGFIKLNISKTGLSVSAGVPRAHINYDLSHRRKETNSCDCWIAGEWTELLRGHRVTGPTTQVPGHDARSAVLYSGR